MKKLRVVAALVLAFPALALAGNSKDPKDPGEITARLISPAPGAVLFGGTRVELKWELKVPKDLDLRWCEQELYLSLDGGRTVTYRLTPQLDPAVRSFTWQVPNIKSDSVVIDLRFGSDADGFVFERSHLQVDNVFTVSPGGRDEGVLVKAGRSGVDRSTAQVTWESTVQDVKDYEVLVSLDAGAHFMAAGRTTETSIGWKAPEGFKGDALFRVIASRQDGSTVESPMKVRDLVRFGVED